MKLVTYYCSLCDGLFYFLIMNGWANVVAVLSYIITPKISNAFNSAQQSYFGKFGGGGGG